MTTNHSNTSSSSSSSINSQNNVWSYDQPSSAVESAATWDAILKGHLITPKTDDQRPKADQTEVFSSEGLGQSLSSFTDSRQEKIFYHLSAIFPADQVRRAMASLSPVESADPQRIFTQIIAMQSEEQDKS